MPRVIRVLTVFMAVVFLLALLVQYNDPDPLEWMAIYGAAALACVFALAGRLPRWAPLVIGVVAAIWAAALAPRAVGQVAASDLFREVGMMSPAVEEARETIGLLIVAAWMLVLAAVAPRVPRAEPRRA